MTQSLSDVSHLIKLLREQATSNCSCTMASAAEGPPPSPVWEPNADALDPSDTVVLDDVESGDAASPRGGDDTDAGFVELAPAGALPNWADAVSDSSDDEPDCHICRLTAEEMGEPLVVVCSCTSLPVHLSCRELPPRVSLSYVA